MGVLIRRDGDVFGPESSTDGSIALFDGETGKHLKEGAGGGITITTTVDDPGTDQEVPTGQAVREAINAFAQRKHSAIYYEIFGPGSTTGQVTLPAGGGADVTFELDYFSTSTDAWVSTVSGGRPTGSTPLDATRNKVTTTFDAAGNYALSAACDPDESYAIIYAAKAYIENMLPDSEGAGGYWHLVGPDNVVDEDDMAAITNGVAAKTAIADADKIPLIDTEASNALKTSTWANIKSLLATWANGLYVQISGALGTPSSGTLTSCSGLPIVGGTTGTLSVARGGTGVTTSTGTGSTVLSTSPVLTTPTRAAAITDNDSTLALASTAFAKSQDAVIVNPKAMAQAVNMTAAASGSTGIVVADNDNLDFGTGDFTLVWKGSLPNWSPTLERIFEKGSSGNPRILLYVYSGGYFAFNLSGTIMVSTVGTNFVSGSTHEIVVVVSRGSLCYFYVDGWLLGTSVADTSSGTVSGAESFYINGSSSVRSAGRVQSVHTYNRALTAAEVLSHYRNGVAFADKWGSQTVQTSGTLTTDKRYRIVLYVAGDDFTNIGGTNETGNIFVATGTTPTTWTNSSQVKPAGATLALESMGIQPAGANSQWLDSSTNKLNATLPAAGATNTQKIDSGRYRWTTAMTDDTTWTSILPAGFELERIILNNSTANTCTLRLGTSAGGTEMITSISVAASTFTTALCNKVVSLTADTTLYLSDTGGGWGSCSLTATLYFRRFN